MFSNELITAAESLLGRIARAELKIAVAESCTGGLITACLTEIPGASDVFEHGFVTYSDEAKFDLLGVPSNMVEDHGAVSEDVAKAMAVGALERSRADISVAVTGIAGPSGGSDDKPVGLVHLAAAKWEDKILHVEKRFGDQGRGEVRLLSVAAAFELLNQLLDAGDNN